MKGVGGVKFAANDINKGVTCMFEYNNIFSVALLLLDEWITRTKQLI